MIEEQRLFKVDGKPFQLISGSIHYFRVVPEYWQDRLEKLKAMGCNTVETYIPWNLHEPVKGEFHFDGMLDVGHFIELAQKLGLYVVLRPSPYICAEWEFGGLPAWLLKEEGMKLRCNYGPYMQAVRDYYSVLIPYLAPYQIDQGGPVIMMQVENEYGYYGNDHSYMQAMHDMMREMGITVPLFTSDGPYDHAFIGGKIPGLLQGGNFGSHAEERFEFMRKYVDGPLSCMEFWLGWFDDWGSGMHHTTDAEQNVKDLAYMLDHGHVNIYMFIGGTNFGFMNGANYYDVLTPDVTSYDYDAVLTEDGQITRKYTAFKEEIGKRFPIPEVTLSTKIIRKAFGEIPVRDRVSLFETLDTISHPVENLYPLSMEKLGQSYGYILYHSELPETPAIAEVRIKGGNDRAKVYTNQEELITLYDRQLLEGHKIEPMKTGTKNIDILMENMGRVNFGPFMEQQRKGIDGPVILNTQQHFNWTMYPLPMDKPEDIDFSREFTGKGPGFHRFYFNAEVKEGEYTDTFLDMSGWGKGIVYINGFNLGRFWEIGPQVTLYVPGPLLQNGVNEIIIFETEGKYQDTISLVDKPNLG
ncbi:MAG: beta-galactosidase [Lachnospiraceae bacterium]|nr:beta-galactosidase [Lachnospiraceae bacterium]